MRNYSNRKWIIINVSDITNEMISKSIQSSIESLRTSIDGNKAILKYEGRKPSCFYNMNTYTHSEILEELSKSDWTNN
jgi:hypothetical protein